MTDTFSFKEPIYIVAGTYSEFQAYRETKKNDGNKYIYVENAERLRGMDRINGYYIGSYLRRMDYEEVKFQIDVIKHRQKLENDVAKAYDESTSQTFYVDDLFPEPQAKS